MSSPFFIQRRHAFSLTELLVAVVVCAVLALLLMMAVAQFRERANAVQCISRLRHLWTLWKAHHEETGPALYSGNNAWIYVMADSRALRSAEETLCPATLGRNTDAYFYPNPYAGKIGTVRYWSGPPAKPIGYSVNNFVFYRGEFLSVSSFQSLPRTPLFLDGKVYGLAPGAWSNPSLLVERVAFRHGGRANVVFLDGHAESLGREGATRLDPRPR